MSFIFAEGRSDFADFPIIFFSCVISFRLCQGEGEGSKTRRQQIIHYNFFSMPKNQQRLQRPKKKKSNSFFFQFFALLFVGRKTHNDPLQFPNRVRLFAVHLDIVTLQSFHSQPHFRVFFSSFVWLLLLLSLFFFFFDGCRCCYYCLRRQL